jgi:SOS-response transcriptional repressor LexA
MDLMLFLADYTESHGFPPSFQEISEAIGLANKSSASQHLSVLRDAGFVAYAPRKFRTVTLTEAGRLAVQVMKGWEETNA